MKDDKRMHAADAEHPEDLVALERQQWLSEPEQRRLQMCLASSDSLRLLYQVGLDFDAMPTVRPEDAAQLEQLVASAHARFAARTEAPSSRTPVRKIATGVAFSVLLFALGATAARWQLPRFGFGNSISNRSVDALPTPVLPKPEGQVAHAAAAPPNCPAPNDSAAAVPSIEAARKPQAQAIETAPGASPASSVRAVAQATSPRATAGCSELFSAANAARRRGDGQRAATLYSRLQGDCPRSAQAASSYVLLARMNLARGAAAPALDGFDTYLQAVPRGSLIQEALQGKAQALRQLGRSAEERAALRELLRQFPDSVYAPSARQRLASGNK